MEQANQIIEKIQEICDEKLQATKSEHIFVERGFNALKETIARLADKQEENKNTEEE